MPIDELTNDEATWTNPVPATEDDLRLLLREYVPSLCNAFVWERHGGETEVYLKAGGFKFYADNVAPNGGLVENKAAALSGKGKLMQLSNYLHYIDENGGSLDYNFFRNPIGSLAGPNSEFASALADAAIKYDMGLHIYDYDWWEELQ